MFEITNIFGKILNSILDKQQNEVANLAKYVHLCRLIFQSQNIDYFTPNQQ